MLTTLTVKNFTLVEHLELDFTKGMTVFTGETGAGKSLIVGALAMALGDRADTDRIRHQANWAEVSACFDLRHSPHTINWLHNNDFNYDGSECLLRRIVRKDGRSRGYINGQPATMKQLRKIGEQLIDIHSQHEHQSLLRRETHLKLLDEFAGCTALINQIQSLYQQWIGAKHQLDMLEKSSDELLARRELLSYQLTEFDQLDLQEGELDTLEQQQHRLANAESILKDGQTLINLCVEAETFNLQTCLNQALQILRTIPSKTDALQQAEALLSSAQIEVDEASREIKSYLDNFQDDPHKLAEIDEHLSIIYALARKHKIDAEQLIQKRHQLRQDLALISDNEGHSATLRNTTEHLAKDYLHLATQLSDKRAKAAKQLSKAVEKQFELLSMPGAKFLPILTPLENNQFAKHGLETIEFLIATNLGDTPKPLARVASGGELSRISLAIQVIAAENSAIPTLVFDEVDVGIGGATAAVVGQLLHQIGQRGQVLCVTHQPQVASCAQTHFLVSKESNESTTHSYVKALSEPERVLEIARMLGGINITDATLSHAKEMLNSTHPKNTC